MYQIILEGTTLQSLVRSNPDGTTTSIPSDPANTDYAAYLEWVEAGNTPEPALIPEPPAPLTTEQKLEAAGLTVAELRELFGLPAPELELEPVDGQT